LIERKRENVACTPACPVGARPLSKTSLKRRAHRQSPTGHSRPHHRRYPLCPSQLYQRNCLSRVRRRSRKSGRLSRQPRDRNQNGPGGKPQNQAASSTTLDRDTSASSPDPMENRKRRKKTRKFCRPAKKTESAATGTKSADQLHYAAERASSNIARMMVSEICVHGQMKCGDFDDTTHRSRCTLVPHSSFL
jgi:hypothetical protein